MEVDREEQVKGREVAYFLRPNWYWALQMALEDKSHLSGAFRPGSTDKEGASLGSSVWPVCGQGTYKGEPNVPAPRSTARAQPRVNFLQRLQEAGVFRVMFKASVVWSFLYATEMERRGKHRTKQSKTKQNPHNHT